MKSKIDKLKEIGDLLNAGTISQEEFVKLKSEILIDSPEEKKAEPAATVQATVSSTTVAQNPSTTVVVEHRMVQRKANWAGITGFIIAIAGGVIWPLALPFGIIGLVFSIIGMARSRTTHKKGLAIAGFIISLVLLMIVFVIIVVLVGNSPRGWRY